MVCPFCLSAKTNVYNSRATQKINEIWRRRRCQACSREFTTREHTDPQSVIKVATGTKKVLFSRSKLLLSILRACDHRSDDDVIFYLVEVIQQKLYAQAAQHNQLVTPQNISEVVSEVLERTDPIAYVKYTAAATQGARLAKLLRKSRQKPTS